MHFDNGRYDIQGINPVDLCAKYGTPLYVYDTEIIENQFNILRGAFSAVKDLRINYAMKALSNVSILRFMHGLGSCVDTVSIEEVKTALSVGYAPHEIGFTPSGVAWDEIEEAVSLGVKVHADSLPFLEKFGEQYGATYPIGIRLNPHVMAGGNLKISTAHERSKFGISIVQVPNIHAIRARTGLVIEGLHQHTGSEIKEAEVFLQVAEIMLEAAKTFPDLRYLDFGGGFKVPYKNGEKGTDMQKVGAAIAERFNAFCREYGRDLTLIFEPGKFLVAECGTLLVRVNVVKHNPSVSFAHTDSGLNHLIRPMMYDAYHEIVNVSNPLKDKRLYHIVGYICETDNFAEDREMPEITEGDILGICNAGAYGYMMASNYNSRFRPAEVMIHKGKDYLIRRRETMDDILKNQIDVALPQAVNA